MLSASLFAVCLVVFKAQAAVTAVTSMEFDAPGVPTNLCDGVDAVFENFTIYSPDTRICAATGSVQVAPTAIIDSGAKAKIISPRIILLPGFGLPAGEGFDIDSRSPMP